MPGEMVVVSTHRRGFAPPVWRMLQVLTTQIDSWLDNLDTEIRPRVLLWPDRPHDRLRIDVEAEGSRSVLRWSLESPAGDLPGDQRVRSMRYKINQLLNGQLRDHLDNRG